MWTSETDWKRQDSCSICSETFSKLRGISQHHCRICGNSVCNRHSLRRVNKPDEPVPVRVCDSCIDRSIIEEKRTEYKAELRIETEKLGKIKSSSEDFARLLAVKQEQLSSLESEMSRLQRTSRLELEQLRSELELELNDSEITDKLIDSLREEINATHIKERMADEGARLAEVKALALSEEISELKTHEAEVKEQIEYLEIQLEGSVPLVETQKICCEKCLRRLMAQSKELHQYDE